MHSASSRQTQSHAGASPRTTPPAAVSTVVRCRRLGGRETMIDHAASKMFQNGNTSCGLCADDNAGQFPCQQNIRKKK